MEEATQDKLPLRVWLVKGEMGEIALKAEGYACRTPLDQGVAHPGTGFDPQCLGHVVVKHVDRQLIELSAQIGNASNRFTPSAPAAVQAELQSRTGQRESRHGNFQLVAGDTAELGNQINWLSPVRLGSK